MTTAAKIAITLPHELFTLVERVCKSARVSRSALIQQALRAWMQRGKHSVAEQAYVAGYRTHPERAEEKLTATQLAALVEATSEDWE